PFAAQIGFGCGPGFFRGASRLPGTTGGETGPAFEQHLRLTLAQPRLKEPVARRTFQFGGFRGRSLPLGAVLAAFRGAEVIRSRILGPAVARVIAAEFL